MKWYKQVCDVFDRDWAKDSKAVQLYLYLHCTAYFQDSPFRGQIIRRGSLPTSRSAIMEATGLSEYDVKRCLKLLLNKGAILIKSSNIGTIITCCDYDGYVTHEDIFGQNLSSGLPNQLPSGLPNQLPSTPIYNKNIEYKNLRSNNIPSKMERESREAYLRKIKDLYNKTFADILPEWKRLSLPMMESMEMCITRYGRESVDMVFDQVHHEKFHLGYNNTGFITDFRFIFKLENYEAYLSRYKLRLSKKKSEPQQSVIDTAAAQPIKTAQDNRRDFLLSWIDSECKRQTERGQDILTTAYNNGEMTKLGIDWKPNSIAI